MNRLLLLLCVVVPALWAQETKNHKDVPPWAAELRVTGIMRQGGHAQASIERPGVMVKFVREGDSLPGHIIVLEINYAHRNVTMTDGKDIVTLRVANVMTAPPQPVVVAQQQQGADKNNHQGTWPNPPEKTTAMRDGEGRWHVVFPNGRAMNMESYAERHGGIQATIDHVKEHMKNDDNPDRREFHVQQLRALKSMNKAGVQ
ncbi:MAG: hypothetical protein NTY01_11830 [Verrucomicrobia bacterium]|nr:hypothetical protein [Verrucomicrobiota bacterium]